MKKLFYFLSLSIFFLAASCSGDEPEDYRSEVLPDSPTRTDRVYKTTNPQRHRVEDSEAQKAIFIQTKDNME